MDIQQFQSLLEQNWSSSELQRFHGCSWTNLTCYRSKMGIHNVASVLHALEGKHFNAPSKGFPLLDPHLVPYLILRDLMCEIHRWYDLFITTLTWLKHVGATMTQSIKDTTETSGTSGVLKCPIFCCILPTISGKCAAFHVQSDMDMCMHLPQSEDTLPALASEGTKTTGLQCLRHMQFRAYQSKSTLSTQGSVVYRPTYKELILDLSLTWTWKSWVSMSHSAELLGVSFKEPFNINNVQPLFRQEEC